MVLSIISLVLGMLTKEVAVAFLPGALLLLVASRQTIPDMTDNDALGTRRSRRTVAFFVLGAIFAGLFYYGLRTLAATPHPRLKLTLLIMQTNIQHIVRTSLEALGFYMKKIFMPYPLNLAILEVDPLYQLLGIPIFLVCIYLILRRTLMSALFMCGVFLITPSFVIALKQIAWTPYAERYLYIPLGFILVSTLYYLHRNLEFPSAVFKRTAVIGLIGAMCIYSVTRNFTRQSNIRLCEDTLEKSPTCKELLMVYGGLLDDRGEYEKALVQFRRAASLRGIGYDERPDIYAAEILERRGDIDEAYAVYREVLERSKGKSRKALARVVSILEGRTERVLSEKERLQAMKERISTVSPFLSSRRIPVFCTSWAISLWPSRIRRRPSNTSPGLTVSYRRMTPIGNIARESSKHFRVNSQIRDLILLLRPKHWIKNLFLSTKAA